jgi:hypothetical protein
MHNAVNWLWEAITIAEVADTEILYVLGLVGAVGLGVFAMWGLQK